MQGLKREFLVAARSAGLLDLARRRSEGAVRILCYHGLWLGDPRYRGDSMFMRHETFVRRLDLIRSLGYPVISLATAIAALKGQGAHLSTGSVVITIDDGWASTATGMLPALEARGMPATLYCDSQQLLSGHPSAHIMAHYFLRLVPEADYSRNMQTSVRARYDAATDLARPQSERLGHAMELGRALGIDVEAEIATRTFSYMSPSELAAAHHRGLDVQLHTHRHTLGDLSYTAVESEIVANRAALASVLGCSPEALRQFCYPSGIHSPAAARMLASLGVDSATTTVQGLAWPGEPLHLLPRLLDGENLSEIEFEAELSGFGDWLRAAKPATWRARMAAREVEARSATTLAADW